MVDYNQQIRTKKADTYQDFVLECLLKYPDMSAAQLYDWIKGRICLETLNFQERCSRDYVKSIHKEYYIKKTETSRQYETMDEMPPGRHRSTWAKSVLMQ